MKDIKIVRLLMILILLLNVNLFTFYDSAKAYNKMNFKNISIEDGLSQATVETMFQDSRGYIWIGTHDGLNRYDGYDFKVYKYEEGNNNSIASNTIIDIEEDSKGNIWVGTTSGLSKIDISSDTVKSYYNRLEYGNLSHYNICDILITEDDDILIATADGLNTYNEGQDSFTRILNDENGSILAGQVIYSLDQDEFGDIWIGTDAGLNKVNLDKNTVEGLYLDNLGEDDTLLYKVYADKEGFVWVGTLNSGLLKIDISNNNIEKYQANQNKVRNLPGNTVRDILKDGNDNIWVCTEKGLAKFDREKGEFLAYKNKIYDNMSIVDSNTYSIIQDKSGLIWVGALSGISIFDPNNKIKHYKHDPFIKNSLSDDSIEGIYEDESGLLWIGTSSKGINILDRELDTITHINEETYNFVCNKINYITGVGNIIWVATDSGLIKIDKESKTLEKFTIEEGLINNNITALFIDKYNYLWIGTSDGVNILNLEDDSIIDITDNLKSNGIIDTYISSIYQDGEGVYWIGSFIDSGLIKIDKDNKIIRSYKKEVDNLKSISSNAIYSIVEDEENNLWIGTKYGLNKFCKDSEEFVRYTEKDGLANNNVYGVLIDDYNNPWISTNYGISKLEVNENQFINLNITDGLQSNEFNGNSYYKTGEGDFLFGGINGINIFNPNELTKSDYAPKLIFGEFEVNGDRYNNIDGLVFDYTKNTIKFKLFLPDFKNTNKIQYYYQLKGLSDEWTEIKDNQFTYNNLLPGKYTLKVKARNYDGTMSEEEEVSFKIKAPLWRRPEAILVYLIIICILLYNNRNKMKKLDKMVDQRTKQLKDEMNKNTKLLNKVINLERNKNNFFVNLSHELRTPLNVISSTEQLISSLNKEGGIDKTKLANYMDGIKRNSERLLKLINSIIDTTKIESGRYDINFDSHDIIYLVEETALSLKEYVESNGIELVIDPEVEEKIIKCDKNEIERCIVNLVSNAIKFTPVGGKIQVILKDLVDKVKIEVIDNGVGIDPKYHKFIFDRFNQVAESSVEVKGGSGLGLTITKQIIEIHRGEIYLESELGKGSKFIIILPVEISN